MPKKSDVKEKSEFFSKIYFKRLIRQLRTSFTTEEFTERYRKTLKDTERYRKTQKDTERHRKTQKDTERPRKETRKTRKMRNSPKGDQKYFKSFVSFRFFREIRAGHVLCLFSSFFSV